MKLLFIGGTGLISSACSELALKRGHELWLVNRSRAKKYKHPDGAHLIEADLKADPTKLGAQLQGQQFDAVVDFIAFTVPDIERDLRLFEGRTRQFVFISSASAYQKPPQHYLITEQTPLENPYWEYSRGKIECEARLMQAHRSHGFPATIVRPSLTYGPAQIPFCVGSWEHPWTVIDRMLRGLPVVVPGDGTSLWVLTWNADFAEGLLGLLGNPNALGEAFHITSDEVLTWDQIYIEAYHALGVKPNLVHVPADVIAAYWPHALGSLIGDKIHSVVFDNSRIRKLVPDFRCEVQWAEGLRRAINWHEAHPEFQTIDRHFDALMNQIVRGWLRAQPTEGDISSV